MGVTRFSGPVYGAKAGLMTFAFAAGAITSNASTALLPAAITTIPTYESWVLTGLWANVSTCSSNNYQFKVKFEAPTGGGSAGTSTTSGTIHTLGSGTSTSISSFVNPTTPTPGEYEGFVVPPGSTLRIVSSGNSAPGITNLNLHGYIRYVDSTRAV